MATSSLDLGTLVKDHLVASLLPAALPMVQDILDMDHLLRLVVLHMDFLSVAAVVVVEDPLLLALA